MNDAIPQEQRHWTVRWAYAKWPAAVKAASVVVAIAGGIGTIMGVVGSLSKGVKDHDEAVRVKVIAEQERVQRDKKIDETLKFHGQQIWAVDKKIDVLGQKLDDIKTIEKQKQ